MDGDAYEPTPTNQLIADMTREGRADAEIGVRLGLPVSEVRSRRARLGAARASEVSIPAARGGQGAGRRLWMFGVMAGALAVIIVLAVLAWRAWPGPDAQPPAEAVTTYADLGKVILTPNGEPITVNERDALTLLDVPAGTLIQPYGPAGWSASWNNGFALTGQVDGRWVQVLFSPRWAGFERQFSTEAVRVMPAQQPRPGEVPMIVVTAAGIGGEGAAHRVRIRADGHLLVAVAGTSTDAIVNTVTGESLDRTGALRVGQLGAGRGSTSCQMDEGVDHTCSAFWQPAGEIISPVDGMFRCTADHAFEIVAQEPALTIRLTPQFGGGTCDGQPGGFMIRAGAILSGDGRGLRVQVFDAAGSALSTAMAADGTIYAGVQPRVGCPCVGGGR